MSFPSPAQLALFALAACAASACAAATALALRARARKMRVGRGREPGLVGLLGAAETPLDPDGTVLVRGELWRARSAARAERGDAVRVVGARGIHLLVAPLPNTTTVEER